jgi:hypothetical protein
MSTRATYLYSHLPQTNGVRPYHTRSRDKKRRIGPNLVTPSSRVRPDPMIGLNLVTPEARARPDPCSACASKDGIVTVKQRHSVKPKKGLEAAWSIDTRLKEMTQNRRPKLRPKVSRSPFRKSVPNGHALVARVIGCKAGQLIALSMLVDSLARPFVALPLSIQGLLLLAAYRLLK